MLMTRTLGHGGTERQVAEIAMALDRDRFAPHVACVEGGGIRGDELRRQRVPILELPMQSMLSRQCGAAVFTLRRYFRQHRIRLVHTFDAPMNVFGIPVAKLLGVPVALSSQRAYEELVPPSYRRPIRFSHFLADGVVANCRAMEEHLVQHYSIRREKIHVCYNGIDTTSFAPGPRNRPDILRDASLVIGTVCVLRPEKGLQVLLEAFSLIRGLHRGMRLLIVGSGAEREALEQQSRKLGIAGETIFEPSTSDVASWLRAIDVFVLPSLSEALSNSIMEAMACGCCAVASRVGGNPELVRDRQTGLLFDKGSVTDLASKLRLLVEEPGLRDALAQAAQAYIRDQFSIHRSVGRMGEIYRGFLKADRIP